MPWASLEGGFGLSISSKYKHTLLLPVLASWVRSVTRVFFFGTFEWAFSSLSAAFSAFFRGFSRAGSARSSS